LKKKKLNKSEIIKLINEETSSLSKPDIKESIDLLTDFLSESLKSKNRIEVRGFGTFSTRFRKQYFSRDPSNGKAIFVNDKHYIYFRASKILKRDLNS